MNRLPAAVAIAALLGPASAAFAQAPETRAEALSNAREEKEQNAEPYRFNFLERTMSYLEERPLFGRDGLYPKLGSLTVGSGFAYGVGYRTRDPFKRYGTLDVWVAQSRQKYFAVEARATFPKLAGGRIFAEAYGSRRDYPEERFFGIGPDSRRSDQADYLFASTLVGGRAGVRPAKIVLVGGGVDYLNPYIGRGRSDSMPTISTAFDDASAPGLAQQPTFIRSSAFAEVDYRKPRNLRKGGLYRLEFSHYNDRQLDSYSFNRVDVDLQPAVTFLSEP